MPSATDPELPDYADVTGPPTTNSTIHLESQGRARSPHGSEFRTGLQDDHGYAWLILQLKSRSPSATSIPFFVEGDVISGVVELDTAKTDSVKAVLIEVWDTVAFR